MAYNPKVVRPRFGQVSIYNRDKTMDKKLMYIPTKLPLQYNTIGGGNV